MPKLQFLGMLLLMVGSHLVNATTITQSKALRGTRLMMEIAGAAGDKENVTSNANTTASELNDTAKAFVKLDTDYFIDHQLSGILPHGGRTPPAL